MQVHDYVHLVGSGDDGFSLSDRCDCHVWLLEGEQRAVLVDAGAGRDPERVLALIDETGCDRSRVDAILVTHAHADHAGGTRALRDALGAKVMASPAVARILREGDAKAASVQVGQLAGAYPSDYRYARTAVDRELADGDRIDLGGVDVEIIDTPGHAAGHLCFLAHAGDRRDLFSGDMLLAGGRIILQDTWDCDLSAYIESVRRLQDLEVTGLFPGHFSFAVERGHRHIEEAASPLAVGQIPPTL